MRLLEFEATQPGFRITDFAFVEPETTPVKSNLALMEPGAIL